MSKTNVKNRYFEEVAIDLLDACGGELTQEGIQKFWKREERLSRRLSELAKVRIITIAYQFIVNP